MTVSSIVEVSGNMQVNDSPKVGETVKLKGTDLTDNTEGHGGFAFSKVAPGSYPIVIRNVDLP